MKIQKNNIARNLSALRQSLRYSQEEVAERVGVSRQTVAKWESGESIPDLLNCDMLARLYSVSVDDLIYFDGEDPTGIPPRDKHIFGTTVVGARGQVVIPKAARDMLELKEGDRLVVLGDSSPENRWIALIHADSFLQAGVARLDSVRSAVCPGKHGKPPAGIAGTGLFSGL